MNEVRFYIDPESGRPHCEGHNVAETEVLEVLQRSPLTIGGRDGSFISHGQTLAGRYLRVIWVRDDEQNGVFVITAYDLTGKSLAAFRRRQRQRRR
jgi:hypothetical protein